MVAAIAIPSLITAALPACISGPRASSLQIAIAVCLLLVAGPAAAEVKLYCEVSKFGTLALGGTSWDPKRGAAVTRDTAFIRQTDRIPMEMGTTFGIKTAILGRYPKPETDFQVIWRVPPRTPPGSIEPVSTLVYDGRIRLGRAVFPWFSFDEQWKLVAGTYRVEVVHDGKMLCGRTFDVSPTHNNVALTAD
jgi:hypothetical protein